MTAPEAGADRAEDIAEDVEIVEDDALPGAAPARPWRGPSAGRWVLFAVIAIAWSSSTRRARPG